MSQVFYDKCGKRLHEFDVIKVLAYIGPRINGKGDLCIQHLDCENSHLVPLTAVTEIVDGKRVFKDAEVVQTTARSICAWTKKRSNNTTHVTRISLSASTWNARRGADRTRKGS